MTSEMQQKRIGILSRIAAMMIKGFARLLTGARGLWHGCEPEMTQRIYFANHASHADFVLVWTTLPPRLQEHTRPVAGADYWNKGRLRRFIIHDVFNGVLIERDRDARTTDPIEQLNDALEAGDSLIVFPEGTRNLDDDSLLAFKSGIYHLARKQPHIELVPTWIENAQRAMPKGHLIPLPLLCSVHYGTPLRGSRQTKRKTLSWPVRARHYLMPRRNPALRVSATHEYSRTGVTRLRGACRDSYSGHGRGPGAEIWSGSRPRSCGDRQSQRSG